LSASTWTPGDLQRRGNLKARAGARSTGRADIEVAAPRGYFILTIGVTQERRSKPFTIVREDSKP